MKLLSQLLITVICSLQSWVAPIVTALVEGEAPVEENQWCIKLHEDKFFVVNKTAVLGVSRPVMDQYNLVTCCKKINNNPKNIRL